MSSHDLHTLHIERNQCARNTQVDEHEDLDFEAEAFGEIDPNIHEEENRAAENGEICDGESLKKRAALVITALLSQPNLTYSTIERMIQQSSNLVDSIVSNLEFQTKQFLENE